VRALKERGREAAGGLKPMNRSSSSVARLLNQPKEALLFHFVPYGWSPVVLKIVLLSSSNEVYTMVYIDYGKKAKRIYNRFYDTVQLSLLPKMLPVEMDKELRSF
jgi:hypothetical protein